MSIESPQNIPARPFLKWAGGKSKLIQQYIPYLPQDFKNYYEPFLGGGAVFFHLKATPAFLTDINSDLINAYCCVRDKVDELIDILNYHQQQHSRNYYYWMREFIPLTEIERAARLIYLNKTCFNGLYRENSKGKFNVPIGKYKNPQICNQELLHSVSSVLQSAKIEVNPFEKIINFAKNSNDFVYFDPPYHPISLTSNFTSYSRHSFKEVDQIRLRDVCLELARRGVKVMQSNSDCPFIRELYKDFNIYPVLAPRAINSNAKKRGRVTELVITSYKTYKS